MLVLTRGWRSWGFLSSHLLRVVQLQSMEGKCETLFTVKPFMSLTKSDLIVTGQRLNPDQSTLYHIYSNKHCPQISTAFGTKKLISSALE